MGTWNWRDVLLDAYDLRDDIEWYDRPGIYIFAGWDPRAGSWFPVYVGRCDSFRDRMRNHEKLLWAVALGATHVHARAVYSPALRRMREAGLIRAFNPPLNVQHPSAPPWAERQRRYDHATTTFAQTLSPMRRPAGLARILGATEMARRSQYAALARLLAGPAPSP